MWPLFKIINLIYLLVSGYVWFGFLLPSNFIPIAVSIFMIICYALGNFNIKFTPKVYALFGVLLVYFLWSTFIIGIPYGLLMLTSYTPAVLLFMLEKHRQQNLLDFVTKWVCIILIFSLFGFLISSFVNLPHSPFMPEGFEKTYSSFENYYIFIKRTSFTGQNLNIVRFCGPFLEPGHLSMVCCLLLFANGFRLKQKPLMWILVISVVVSLSLAGYVILLAGLFFTKIRNVYTISALLALGFGIWFSIAVLWNDGQNPVNIMIFQRLEMDDSKGIKGNNRTVIQTDYFFKQCVDDGSIWLGIRNQKVSGAKILGAGYKIFLLRYGVISTMIVALIYLMLIPPRANRRYAISFFIIMLLLFMQRAYPWAYSWLLPYVLGLGVSRGRSFTEISKGISDTEEDYEMIPDLSSDTVDIPVTDEDDLSTNDTEIKPSSYEGNAS